MPPVNQALWGINQDVEFIVERVQPCFSHVNVTMRYGGTLRVILTVQNSDWQDSTAKHFAVGTKHTGRLSL